MDDRLPDLQDLLERIRDAYPGSLEETIVTEIVASALDSGAARLHILTDAAASTLTLIDDGSGLTRRDLARHHDIAARPKSRRRAIGGAGVGIKLGLLAAEDVLTESKRGKKEAATLWHLASRDKAQWRWVLPRGLVRGRGTAVRLRVRSPHSPLLDAGFVEAVLRHRFQPLFDPAFDEILAPQYPRGVRLLLNREVLARRSEPAHRAPLAVRLGRERTPSAVGYLAHHAEPLPGDDQGLAISTRGKVIRRGWDWLGLAPPDPLRTSGLVEVPDLVGSLSANKAAFVRTGRRGALYLAYRKALQQAVSPRGEETRRRRTRPVERDLTTVLTNVAGDYPRVEAARNGGAPKRPGLSIQFESRPDDPNLGRLAETTVWVNESHPAYLRAAASRSDGYHLALTVALALAPLAAEPSERLSFVTAFLSKWGEVTDRPARDSAALGMTALQRSLAMLLLPGLSACGMNRYRAVWTADTRAPLSSHVAIAGDCLLIPNLSDDRDSILSCFALADGTLRWQVPLEDIPVENVMSSVFAIADPDGTAVYLAQGADMASFAVKDGAQRWARRVPEQEPFEDFSVGTPPVVVGDRVYLLSRHCRVVAVDKHNGSLVFRTDLGQADLLTVRAGAVITRAYEDKNVAAHDAQTGDPLWTHAITAPFQITTRLETSIRLAPDSGPYLFFDERALRALDPRSGAVRWEQPVVGLASYASAGAVVVVTDSASVRGIDPKTGAERWRHPTGGHSFVAPLDDTTALLALNNAVCTVDANTGAIRKHARHSLHEQDGVLDARNGLAVVSTDNGIARFYWREGNKLVERTIGERLPRITEPRARVSIARALISRKSVFTFNNARELQRFVR